MSVTAPPVQPLPKFDDTFGAALVGGFLASILFGVLCVQCYLFFQRSHGETIHVKISIAFLLIFNIMHTICIIHSLYWFVVTNFMNALVLLEAVPWSLPTTVLFTGLIDVTVQGWFTYRVWRLSDHNKLLTLVLAVLTLVVFGNCMALVGRLFQVKTFPEYAKINWLVYFGLGATVATDFGIALSLCYLLRKLRGMALRRTHSMVNYLMVYVINTGLLTSFVCIATLVSRITMQNNFVFVALFYSLGSLYSNALLGSLNARDWFRHGSAQGQVSIPLTTLTSSSGHSNTRPIEFARVGHLTREDSRLDVAERGKIEVEVKNDVVKATL
ncbi:hypothetical protein PsYK624_045770 [Phanerochaete sordida]|uniref:DUF6534 domain-containing protein n=1 Tax=Phanerochaete sordida TaxID=48140 RepID=A0A9P3LBF0_9APHY|nr:hypothetical protein PsYK624_045770 [Phanerochaete sordida]